MWWFKHKVSHKCTTRRFFEISETRSDFPLNFTFHRIGCCLYRVLAANDSSNCTAATAMTPTIRNTMGCNHTLVWWYRTTINNTQSSQQLCPQTLYARQCCGYFTHDFGSKTTWHALVGESSGLRMLSCTCQDVHNAKTTVLNGENVLQSFLSILHKECILCYAFPSTVYFPKGQNTVKSLRNKYNVY